METILEVFSEAQRSAASHKSGNKKILALLGTNLKKDYVKFLLHGCVDKLLLIAKSSTYVDRVTEFTYKLIASLDDETFHLAMIHICSRLSSASKSVRQRCCQIIDGVLTQMTEKNVDLSLDVCAELSKHLLIRLTDKLPTIRQLAVRCLKSLQDPSDPYDLCTEGLVNIMLTDSSHLVRVEAVSSIVLFEGNVPQLCSRLRDVKSEVRVATLNRLSEIDLRMIKNRSKPEVIRLCLTDRDEQVRLSGIKVVMRWLEKVWDNGSMAEALPKFLGLLNPLYNEEITLLLGATIVEELLRSDVLQLYPAEWKDAVKMTSNVWNKNLNSIAVNDMLWIYIRCNYARRNCPVLLANEICNTLMPSVGKITELLGELRDANVSEKKVFVVKYLLRLTSLLGKSEAKLLNECETLLGDINLSVDLVEPVLKALASLYVNNSRFTFSESVLMTINELKEQSRALAEAGDADLSSAYTERALQISYLLLQREVGSGNKAETTSLPEGTTLASTQSDPIHHFQDLLPFVTDCLAQPITNIRTLAVGCLGMLCLYSHTLCLQYKRIILQVVSSGFETVLVRGQAMKCLVDMACIHKETFVDDAELCSALIRAQDSEEPELVVLAAESAAKLLFSGIISEASLFANLLKFFFLSDLLPKADNEVDEEEQQQEEEECSSSGSNARLQQILSIFLQAYMVSEGRCSEVVVNALPQLVADVTNAIKFNGAKVTSLSMILKHLFSLSENVATESSVALKIQMKERASAAICREILKLGNSKVDKSVVKEYIKILTTLLSVQEWIVPEKAFTVHQVLQTLLDSVVLDKTSQKSLQTCVKDCKKMITSSEHTSAGYQFMSSVPGLADLVALASKNDSQDNEEESEGDQEEEEEEVVQKPVRKAAAKAKTAVGSRRSTKKVNREEDSEEEEESGDDSEEAESEDSEAEEQEEDEDVEVENKVNNARSSRASKAVAAKKISKQLVE